MIFAGVCFVLALIAFAIWSSTSSPSAVSQKEEAKKRQAQLVCPHCQSVGTVTSRAVVRKQGVSGGKATGAVMTGGASLFATGLSRKGTVTRMTCSNCGTDWDVA